jgi:DNA-binding PadR family transcriptional regulator/ubiquinone/menaquinone biosynthesis C-methylase UbiE
MQLNQTAYVLLGILAIHDNQSGYEIRKTIQQSVGFFWGESYGQIYPTLKRLATDGLIVPSKSASKTRSRRQEYSITPAGRIALQQWLAIPYRDDPPRDEFLLKLFFGVEAAPGVSIAHIRKFQEKNRNMLAALLQLESLGRAHSSHLPGFPFWILTLEFGLAQLRSALEWSDSALAMLTAPDAAQTSPIKSRSELKKATGAIPIVHAPESDRNMTPAVHSNRSAQIVAWFVVSLFILGFFFDSIGTWTGPILGVWFVGTQKIRRGFVCMLAFVFIPALLMSWRGFPLTGFESALKYLARMLLTAIIGVLPFTFHRLISPRLPGWLSTLPLPTAVVINHVLIRPQLHIAAASGSTIRAFFVFWFAAVVVWMWNHEFERSKVALGAGIFAAVSAIALGFEFLPPSIAVGLLTSSTFARIWIGICLTAAASMTVWALFHPGKQRSWAERPQAVALLQSPSTGSSLHLAAEHGLEALVGSSGERFPIRNGIPNFLAPGDLIGENGKYNHLYETIGGFYDDTQRVACAIRGQDRDSYFANYMNLLEVKPGDSVLETSVGTGLNFKYLPRGVKLSGLDLSREMLSSCQANLRRWGMDADLYLGNAETLPFADSSFDVVYTAGAFNFFNDRAKAIREMIRVAKPGSLLMVEDETEEYVKSTYERIPYTSSFYGDRKQPVTVPIDLVPPEMEDIRVEMLKEGKFYAVTFRKPAHAVAVVRHKMEA